MIRFVSVSCDDSQNNKWILKSVVLFKEKLAYRRAKQIIE